MTQVIFDETFFPARPTDQRITGFYDKTSVDEMRADLYADTLKSTLQWKSSAVHDPIWTPSNITHDDAVFDESLPTSSLEEHSTFAQDLAADAAPAVPLVGAVPLAGAIPLAGEPLLDVVGDCLSANASSAGRNDRFLNIR